MDITRIDALIAPPANFGRKNPEIVKAMLRAREAGRQLHLFGLVSRTAACTPIKSISTHCYAPPERIRPRSRLRACLHGRTRHATDFRRRLHCRARAKNARVRCRPKVASINGRYYAMDRDKRWERERKAFDAMVVGKAEGGAYADPVARIKENYNNGVTGRIPHSLRCGRWRRQSPSARSATRMYASTSISAPTRALRQNYPRARARKRLAQQTGRAQSRRMGGEKSRRGHSPAARFRRICTTCA